MAISATGRHIQGLEGRKGMPRRFIDMLHPKLVDKPPTGPGWLHEIKFDGYRVQAHVEASRVTLYTRNGNLWTDVLPPLPYLSRQLAELEDCVLEGELMAEGEGGYSSFSKLRSAIFNDPDSLVFQAFDILWHCAEDMRPYSLKNRKTVLRQVLDAADVDDVVRYVQPVPGEGRPLLNAACQLRWEGIVSKRLSESYKAGRREAWVKSKCRPSESIVVVGYQTENDRFAYLLGAVRQKDGGLTYAGAIKGGYGADVAGDVLKAIKPLEAAGPPERLLNAPRRSRDIHWLEPKLIAEVEMAEFTGSGMMRQSSFKGFRDDLADR